MRSSANVAADICVYALVRVEGESKWHVQDCAQATDDGSWSTAAWIGDDRLSVVTNGTRLELLAVVAPPGVDGDRKVSLPSELGAHTPLATHPTRVTVIGVTAPQARLER